MKKLTTRIFTVFTVISVFIPAAHAGFVEVPEPGMLPLFAVAAVAFYIAKKRKK